MVDDADLGRGVNDRVAAFETGTHRRRVADVGPVQRNRPGHPDMGENPARSLRIAHEEKRLVTVGEKRGDGV
ncbi:hypothetical protein GCM10010517_32880 [Streptosporangium fragile]|uniref:Uncharacterized protein n=1 Tax=Streptosporangium fragile TaxID=46186 RepID=A0ABP6IDF8_9ACTN